MGQINLNGHLLCAIDTETTGFDPKKHEIIEVAIVPLNSDCRPMEGVLPLHLYLRPDKVENIEPDALTTTKLKLADVLKRGIDPFKAADIFEEWFERLGLPEGKKIEPLGHNYGFDKAFLKAWLGDLSYEHFFHFMDRDTMTSALFQNDHAIFHAERCPFPKVNLIYLCSQLDVKHTKAHTALNDALVTAECYRRMLTNSTYLI